MTKTDSKVEALIAKHPHLTKDEAVTILAEKNKRKNTKRQEKSDRYEAKKARFEEKKVAGESAD